MEQDWQSLAISYHAKQKQLNNLLRGGWGGVKLGELCILGPSWTVEVNEKMIERLSAKQLGT